MKPRRRFLPASPTLLEDRLVPAQGSLAPSALVAGLATRSGPAVALTGTIQGTETGSGAFGQTRLSGQGDVAPLGATHATGRLRERGAEPTLIRATVVLRDAKGTITVQLAGNQFGPVLLPPRPITLTYTIVAGTGAFRGAHGSGKVTLTEGALPGAASGRSALARPFTLQFGDVASTSTSPPPPVNISLTGSVVGRYIRPNPTGVAMPPLELTGQGTISPLAGTASASGSLLWPGGGAGFVSGSLTLTDARGSLTLQLSGVPLKAGPHNLAYAIVGGTGAYAGATGNGLASFNLGGPILILDPLPRDPILGHGGQGGSFSLTFGNAQQPILPLM